MCSLDASKTFDIRSSLLNCNAEGVPAYLIRILQCWYSHKTMQVKWSMEVSESFSVSNGVRQEGILSPVLFDLYLNHLSVTLNDCKTGCMLGNLLVNHLM